jgi:hypothetical protein
MGKQFDLETQSWTDVIDIHEPDEVLPDIDAHGYLIGVYRGTIKANSSRLRAAIACLQFEKPKLQAIALHREGDLVDRLEGAMAASGKVIDGRETQVIEAPKVEALPPDHSMIIPPLSRSGFCKRRF